MSSENAINVANEILADLKGAGYYKDPEILAAYLEGKLNRTQTKDAAKEVAKAILDDWGGARYYKNPEILASFLDD
jgi:hypothetical protein